LNLAAALAVADGVRASGGPELRVRWPNDLVSDGGKVCGILSERRTDTGTLVVGIGLNVNQLAEELSAGGASLRTLTGREFARAPLLAEILLAFEGVLDVLEREGFEPLRARIEERSSLLGRSVTLDLGDRTVTGAATGIGASGGLVVRTGEGTREYMSGEVVRVRSEGS
jgi:BirA family biotin operon repressor/biotin-[acetyl-CoA-carboxylase] ligase